MAPIQLNTILRLRNITMWQVLRVVVTLWDVSGEHCTV